jgi:hypothetical protein
MDLFLDRYFFNAAKGFQQLSPSKMLMNEYKHSEVYMVNICPT